MLLIKNKVFWQNLALNKHVYQYIRKSLKTSVETKTKINKQIRRVCNSIKQY